MARAIKDPAKLIRRAKAVAAKWHNPHAYLPPGQTMSDDSNVWKPFQKALEEIGLSGKEIGEIEDYKSDEKEADLTEGLEQWAEEMFDGKVDKDAGDE
jgi:sugar phosphate isomerase/epimerase